MTMHQMILAFVGGGVAGPSGFGYFGGGEHSGGTIVSSVKKYEYSNDSVTSGTALGTARRSDGGEGNTTVGIFAGGWTGSARLSSTEKYTYSGDSRVAGTALGALCVPGGSSGVGNSTRAIFNRGDIQDTSPFYTTATDKYTYSGDTRAAATALGTAIGDCGGFSNETVGIFAGGNFWNDPSVEPRSASDKYTFSSDTRVAGTALSTVRAYYGGFGTTTYGICAGGNDLGGPIETAQKYTYSGDTVANTTAMGTTNGNAQLAGTDNPTYGIVCSNGDDGKTMKFDFGGATWSFGTILIASVTLLNPGATSSNPGNF